MYSLQFSKKISIIIIDFFSSLQMLYYLTAYPSVLKEPKLNVFLFFPNFLGRKKKKKKKKKKNFFFFFFLLLQKNLYNQIAGGVNYIQLMKLTEGCAVLCDRVISLLK